MSPKLQLYVLTNNGKLVGIIKASDIISALSNYIETMFKFTGEIKAVSYESFNSQRTFID